MSPTLVRTHADAYIVDGYFACADCVPAEARDALNAQPVTGREMSRSLTPTTRCCGERVVRTGHGEYGVAR